VDVRQMSGKRFFHDSGIEYLCHKQGNEELRIKNDNYKTKKK